MIPPPPAENQNPDPTAPAPVVGAAELAAHVQTFWEKNRTLILGACAAGILAIAAVEAWRVYAASRDRGVQQEFAAVGTDAAKLTRFAADHAGHPLAGAALLRLADQRFEAGDFPAAAGLYAQSAESVTLAPLRGRARLGAAMSQLLGGDRAAGETALKALAAEAALPKGVRAEATYHLASMALEDGKREEAAKLAGEVGTLDATSGWAQRAAALRASLDLAAPAATPSSPAAAAPAESSPLFKPGGE